MEIRAIDGLNRTLDFQPKSLWPAVLPAIAWRGLLLNGFERTEGSACHYAEDNEVTLVELLRTIYPCLGIGESARLNERLKDILGANTIVQQMQGWRPTDSNQLLLTRISQWPITVQDWCDERKLSLGDLSIFLSTQDLHFLLPTLEQLAQKNIGRNIGSRILELTGELLLSGREALSPPEPDRDGSLWLRSLEALRFPRTTQGDRQSAQKVDGFPWPSQVQAAWRRHGDMGVLEVQLNVDSLANWEKRLGELQRLTERLKVEGPWRN